MNNPSVISYKSTGSYEIYTENGFEALGELFAQRYDAAIRAFIITDSNVAKLYLDEINSICSDYFADIFSYTFEAGEASKNLCVAQNIYEEMIMHNLRRNDLVIALGGGVVGDITGFVSATYMRGLHFINIPTTLLSMADSSIGGKCGVDYMQYKNMVGAFHMPDLIYANIQCLRTLPGREFASGMGEILKAGLIKNGAFYEWLINHFNEILDLCDEQLLHMISEATAIKASVVEKDPYETGERALLNFGHTAGHALEKYFNFEYSHGECVALGCIVAGFISWKREMISMEDYYELRDMFVPFELGISLDSFDTEKVYELMKNDKKNNSDAIRMILLNKIGKAVIVDDIPKDEIINALNELIVEWD